MFCNRFFSRKFESTWSILIKNIKEESKEEENLFKNTINESKETYLFKIFKEIGNHLFKQNDYESAKDLYCIALILIPFNQNLERSLNFSNMAQCLIFLDYKPKSLIECINALKLQLKHDKSWYRKIFVSKKFKDYIACLKIILTVYSLWVKFGTNQPCIQNEFYGKNIIRLGNVSLRKKRWGVNSAIKKKKFKIQEQELRSNKKKLIIFFLNLIKIKSIILEIFRVYFFKFEIIILLFFFKIKLRHFFCIEIVLRFKSCPKFKKLAKSPLNSFLLCEHLIEKTILFKLKG